MNAMESVMQHAAKSSGKSATHRGVRRAQKKEDRLALRKERAAGNQMSGDPAGKAEVHLQVGITRYPLQEES
jgi:hypothetical protein